METFGYVLILAGVWCIYHGWHLADSIGRFTGPDPRFPTATAPVGSTGGSGSGTSPSRPPGGSNLTAV